jgi:hypothetical protein
MNETNCQVCPSAVVRAQDGRPSRRLAFDAVRNSRQSFRPLMRWSVRKRSVAPYPHYGGIATGSSTDTPIRR